MVVHHLLVHHSLLVVEDMVVLEDQSQHKMALLVISMVVLVEVLLGQIILLVPLVLAALHTQEELMLHPHQHKDLDMQDKM